MTEHLRNGTFEKTAKENLTKTPISCNHSCYYYYYYYNEYYENCY